MRRWRAAMFAAAAALALGAGGVGAQELAPASPKPQVVDPARWRPKAESVPASYTIDATLRPLGLEEAWRIVGDEKVFWTNTSHDSVKVMRFHAYANAFRNTRSTFLREAARDELKLKDDMVWADMPLPRMSIIGGADLAPKWVSLDDGNPDDRTVFEVTLPQAVEFGDRIGIRLHFELEMPHVFRRMGGQRGFVMAAQWYPKLGMYLGRDSTMRNVRDGWYCHQFHAACEFAADFADYDVTLRVPDDFKLGATGVPAGPDVIEDKAGGRERVRRYKAQSVVDFAWTAGRRYIEIERDVTPVDPEDLNDPVAVEWRRVKTLLAVPPADLALPPVHVVLLVHPEHADQADRMFEAARVALGLFGTWLGPYPYERLTIVDPAWDAKAAGGMEYPMLVTAGSVAGSPPDSLRPEYVTVHEICHQWLMGVLASNEAEEAWLDEGVNTYLTQRAMALRYGGPRQYTEILGFQFPLSPFYEFPGVTAGWPELLNLPGWARPPKIEALRLWCDLPPLTYVPATSWQASGDPMLALRRGYLKRAGLDEMVKSGWTYADQPSYGVNAYRRPALFLNSLHRGLAVNEKLGPDEADRRFLRALREYARTFRFRHPTTEDLLRKFREAEADPAAYVDQLVKGAAVLDYSVESVRSGDDPELAGIVDDKGTVKKPGAGPKDASKSHKSVVRLRRRGDAVLPVAFEVRGDDDKSERRTWEAKDQVRDRWRDFAFDFKVTSVRVDPDGVWLQDADLSNNSWTSEANTRPAAKWSVRFLCWLENALLGYGRFF